MYSEDKQLWKRFLFENQNNASQHPSRLFMAISFFGNSCNSLPGKKLLKVSVLACYRSTIKLIALTSLVLQNVLLCHPSVSEQEVKDKKRLTGGPFPG